MSAETSYRESGRKVKTESETKFKSGNTRPMLARNPGTFPSYDNVSIWLVKKNCIALEARSRSYQAPLRKMLHLKVNCYMPH